MQTGSRTQRTTIPTKSTKPAARPAAVRQTGGQPSGEGRGGKQARRRRQTAKRRQRFEAALPSFRLPADLLRAVRRPQLGAVRLAGSGWHASKLLSLLLLIAAASGIIWLQTDVRWFIYRDTVTFANLSYLTPDDLYELSGVDGWSIFWVGPESVREHLLQHPYVADALVQIELPNRVRIQVQEAQPVARWVTGDETFWLLSDGTALAVRGGAAVDDQRLPQIIDVQRGAQAYDPERLAVDPDLLGAALTLVGDVDGLRELRFNGGIGLNFALPGTGYWIYWGDGSHSKEKLNSLLASRQLLDSGEVEGRVIDVRSHERPAIR